MFHLGGWCSEDETKECVSLDKDVGLFNKHPKT